MRFVRLLGLGAIAFATASLLAEVLGRAAGWGALGQGQQGRFRVALTFDDGPSPQTPQLLEVLARHQAKATFFVTQPACLQYPEMLELLRVAEHQIEAHGIWHKPAMLLSPVQEWQQVAWHQQINQPMNIKVPMPKLYRPPYGGHSAFTRLFARLLGRKIALWDVESRDWIDADPQTLAKATLSQTKDGSVILLHDGPALTPALLEELLVGLAALGLKPVTANDLPMRRISLLEGLKRLPASYGL